MTTDETRAQGGNTPANIVYKVLRGQKGSVTSTDRIVNALRAAGLLVEGAPTDEQRREAFERDKREWFVDHEAEPAITRNAFERGWEAALSTLHPGDEAELALVIGLHRPMSPPDACVCGWSATWDDGSHARHVARAVREYLESR